MKNYFDTKGCIADEQTIINNCQWMITHRARETDYECIGWIINNIKDIESKIGDGSTDQPSGDSKIDKRLTDMDKKMDDFIQSTDQKQLETTGAIQELIGDIRKLVEDLQKHNSGILYLKRELDAIKEKMNKPEVPESEPEPEPEVPAPEVPEPEAPDTPVPKPMPKTPEVRSSRKKKYS